MYTYFIYMMTAISITGTTEKVMIGDASHPRFVIIIYGSDID